MAASKEGTTAKWVAISSFIASPLLYLFAIFTGAITIRTTCSNCLGSIQFPIFYSEVSFSATLAAIGVFLFGVTLSLAILWGRIAKPGRPFLGSGLLSAGVLAILFAVFWFSVNLQDAGPRCLGGCAPPLQQYLQGVFLASTMLAVLGLAVAGYGARLLMRG